MTDLSEIIPAWQGLSAKDIEQKLDEIPKEARDEIIELAMQLTAGQRWFPSSGAQELAYFSKADLLLYGGSGGAGKALCLDTPIPTPSGWATMRSLRAGSIVYDETGAETKVIAVSPIMRERKCFEVQFDDGECVVADAEHLWVTKTSKDRTRDVSLTDEWREARRKKRPSRAGGGVRNRPDLALRNAERAYVYKAPPTPTQKTTLEIAGSILSREDSNLNHSIDTCGALTGRQEKLLVPAYTLGAWLGDGTSASASITTEDVEILHEIGKDGFITERDAGSSKSSGNASTYRIRRIGQQVQYAAFGHRTSPMSLMLDLRAIGVLNDKHIPQNYLRATIEERLLLLQGLMDTDGHADTRGKCEYCGVNKRLVDGVRELLISLGVKAVVTEGRAVLYGKDCGPKYRILFTPEFQVFRLPRKAKRLALKTQDRYRRRFVKSVTEIASVPVRCIQVQNRSGQFLCGRGMIPTHNSDLLLGLAATAHKKSLIMRAQFNDLDALTERAIQINGTKVGYNGSPPPSLRTVDGRFIQFTGAALEKWQGQPFDFKGWDEGAQIQEDVVKFHLGWIRTTDPNQRARGVIATNPPVNSQGDWLIGMFRPWLDLTHENPATAGQLRWFIKDPDGRDFEVPDDTPYQFPGQTDVLRPQSRSFIPGRLKDNPYLARTNYQATLDSLEGPLRSAIRDGNFMASRADQEFQVVPTSWIMKANERWTKQVPDYQMTAIGVDVGAGGVDRVVLAPRYAEWFAPLITVSGKDAPNGSRQAALIVLHRRDRCGIVVDVGGGYGGDCVERLKENQIDVIKFDGSSGSTARARDGSGRIFVNRRAEAWWRFREALNPDQPGGSLVALPDDPELRAELSAVRYLPDVAKIQIESKLDVRKRLGRSPDKADAVVMAWAPGDTAVKRIRFGGGIGSAERPTMSNRGFADVKSGFSRG